MVTPLYACDVCDVWCTDVDGMLYHLRSAHSDPRLCCNHTPPCGHAACRTCHTSFSTRSDLVEHIQLVHNVLISFSCEAKIKPGCQSSGELVVTPNASTSGNQSFYELATKSEPIISDSTTASTEIVTDKSIYEANKETLDVGFKTSGCLSIQNPIDSCPMGNSILGHKVSTSQTTKRPFSTSSGVNARAVKKRNNLKIEVEEKEELPILTDEMTQVINDAFISHPSGDLLVTKFNIRITRKDIETLKKLNWLNDEIINFYFRMIVERSKETDNLPSVYATNTFFYSKLTSKGYKKVKRWTRKVDIFSHTLMLIPCNKIKVQ